MKDVSEFDDIFDCEESLDLSIPENMEKLAIDYEIFERNEPFYTDDYYPRMVSCKFPYEAAKLYNIFYLELSIRDVLTWYAANNPDEARQVLQLRDDFYGGDKEDDHYQYSVESPWTLLEGEERAVAVVARAKDRDEREAARREIEAKSEAQALKFREEERETWLPFSQERQALDAESDALRQRGDELDREWEGFVRERETWGEDRQAREILRRAELETQSELLSTDWEGYHARMDDLRRRADASYRQKRKEA